MLPLYDDRPARRFPFATYLTIAVNVWIFVAWQLRLGVDRSVEIGGLVPAKFLRSHWEPGVAHMVSSMFMHGSWAHLLGNMWFLHVFGKNVEDSMGFIRFLLFYLLCGLAADYLYIYFSPASEVPLVGASGAISGVLGAYLLLDPGASIATLTPYLYTIKLPAWSFIIIWIGMQFLYQFASAGHEDAGGVAYMAHIGGFAAGFILIFFFKNRMDSLGSDA